MNRTIIAAFCIGVTFSAHAERRTLSCSVVGAWETPVDQDGTLGVSYPVPERNGTKTTWVFDDDMLRIESANPDVLRSSTFRCEADPDPDAAPSSVVCKRSTQQAMFSELPLAYLWTAMLVPEVGRVRRIETFACYDKDFGPPRGWLPSP